MSHLPPKGFSVLYFQFLVLMFLKVDYHIKTVGSDLV